MHFCYLVTCVYSESILCCFVVLIDLKDDVYICIELMETGLYSLKVIIKLNRCFKNSLMFANTLIMKMLTSLCLVDTVEMFL